MAENSRIEWCHHTFNPWMGCTKVSAGCTNCYAERLVSGRFGYEVWGDRTMRLRTRSWTGPYKWNKRARHRGVRERVFCASLADVFEDRPELVEWRDELWRMIDSCRSLDWLLLTKRPGNIGDMLPEFWNTGLPEHVWLGVSVEGQVAATRIKALLDVPRPRDFVGVRFVSAEPLLGPLDLRGFLAPDAVNWLIVGGESGPKARPMEVGWARVLRDQCDRADIPFFFKQGSRANWPRFRDFGSFPVDLRRREVPGKRSMVEGVNHDLQ